MKDGVGLHCTLFFFVGVNISANGNFSNHKENLKEKKQRDPFSATRRYLDFLKLPIHIISKLFNIYFSPI